MLWERSSENIHKKTQLHSSDLGNKQGQAQITPPFCYKFFYYKLISMWFCHITIAHSSTPMTFQVKCANQNCESWPPYCYPPSHTAAAIHLPDPAFWKYLNAANDLCFDIDCRWIKTVLALVVFTLCFITEFQSQACFPPGGPTFWHLWATLEEELSWATH